MPPRTTTNDADGIDLPGVRSPELTVRLGTSMPWNPRAAEYAEGDQCVSNGSSFPWPEPKLIALAT